MRKYYGPIVLGLAALTVAAPITSATTVSAADGVTESTAAPVTNAAIRKNIEFINNTNRIILDLDRIDSAESTTLVNQLKGEVGKVNEYTTTAEQLKAIQTDTDAITKGKIAQLGIDETLLYIPKVTNETIYLKNTYSKEKLAFTFDKNGKITAAEIVDSTHKMIPTDEKITVPGNLTYNGLSIFNHNKPISNPAHTKIIKENNTVFYATPDNNLNLYTENGEIIPNRALAGDTSWLADRCMDLNGVNYVRVATNEWVRLADGLEINNQIGIITTKNDSALFTADGTRITNRALGKNTAWRTDMSATINGQTMYRVATNEWINALDLK